MNPDILRHALVISLGVVLGVGAGYVLTRRDTSPPRERPSRFAERAPAPGGPPDRASAPSGPERGSTRMIPDSEAFLALAARDRPPSLDELRQLVPEDRRTEDTDELVREVLRELNDEDLYRLLEQIDFTRERVEEDERDVREIAESLASLVLTPPEQLPEGLDPIAFSDRVLPDNSALEPGEQFEAQTGRIYSVMETGDYGFEEIMVKWTGPGSELPILLKTYPVDPSEPFLYVWFRPDAFWVPGTYNVTYYTPNAENEPLATGQYVVEPGVQLPSLP